MKPLRVGVVGVGHMGEYHVRIYSELPNVELVGVVDINEERVAKIRKQYNTIPYNDYTKLFNIVDAVSIAVPTTLHYEIAKDFLLSGIHVLVEKPITSNLLHAKELINLASSRSLILQVGQVERFNAAVQELKAIIREPLLIECRRLGPLPNGRINDTGVILDLLIHDVDVVLNLVDSEISSLSVAGSSVCTEHEDIATVQMMFKNGCIATLTASRVTEDKIRTLSVTQKDAYIFLDYATQDLHIHRQASSKYILTKEVLRYKQESFIERLFVHKDNPLKLELIHFINCILNGTEPKVNPEEELKSLEVTLKILDKLNQQHGGKHATSV
jgi:predicted dehydrogenase